ncbi:glycoside hydrolase family 76 protein [Granulicella sibirica]|nr:glycoside hydrolase family 76 protein [Granulicella sibirica]
MTRASLLLALCFFSLFAPAQTSVVPPSRDEALKRLHPSAVALLQLYDKKTGLFTTTGWWNSANAVTALADESRIARDETVRWIFPDVFQKAPQKFAGFLNEYYDDEGWWALAWIDAYELNPHGKQANQYLQMSESIFDDMSHGWDDTCGGGIWWKKDRHYKNAIANELFLSVAAKLALHTRGKKQNEYLDWANREWKWFSGTGMINEDGLVNDGLTGSCKNNKGTTWSYNQGVVLGGLAALSRKEKKNPELIASATRIAQAAVIHLTDAQGILHDPCEPKCSEDGVQFKGIFNRNLVQLQAVDGDPAFVRFLDANGESVWSNARTPDNRFSTVWSGPPAADNAGAQASALDALNAAAEKR